MKAAPGVAAKKVGKKLKHGRDEEDLENSTVDKIRRVMHLVYSTVKRTI